MIEPISPEAKEKLRRLGRKDLIDINELIRAGFAGLDPITGKVCHRLKIKCLIHLDQDGQIEPAIPGDPECEKAFKALLKNSRIWKK